MVASACGGDCIDNAFIVHGDVEGRESVPLRVRSECHTGDIWGSLRCDCRDQLQDRGLDTVEANQYLGLPADARDYKVDQLKKEKIEVVGGIPIVIPANGHDKGYLDVKKKRMGPIM